MVNQSRFRTNYPCKPPHYGDFLYNLTVSLFNLPDLNFLNEFIHMSGDKVSMFRMVEIQEGQF